MTEVSRHLARRRLLGIGLLRPAWRAAPAPSWPMCRTRRATRQRDRHRQASRWSKTIKVGQRPRGIELTKDGKFILVAVGDDDTIQMIDIKTP